MGSLGHDLANIRLEKKVSLDKIHEATKIPMHLLEAIEDDSIFSNLEENPTYIRSYVRSYAKVLSIDEKEIVRALNKMEKGAYSGHLRKVTQKGGKRKFEFDEEHLGAGEKAPDASADENREESAQDQRSEASPEDSIQETEDDTPTESKTENIPTIKTVDWVDMGRQFQPLESTKSKAWLGAVVVLLILAGSAYFLFFKTNIFDKNSLAKDQNSGQDSQQAQTVTSDSLELNIIPIAEKEDTKQKVSQENHLQNNSFESLPDTLVTVVYAAYGKLEPVRVYTDIMDNINPYWIEKGQAVRFDFVNELRIRGQIRRMVLLMNGHVIHNLREKFYNPESRLLEINRSYFEENPKWLKPGPDSLGIDAPPPSVIKERPIYN